MNMLDFLGFVPVCYSYPPFLELREQFLHVLVSFDLDIILEIGVLRFGPILLSLVLHLDKITPR